MWKLGIIYSCVITFSFAFGRVGKRPTETENRQFCHFFFFLFFFSCHILLKLRLAIKVTNNEHDYLEFMVSSIAPYCGCYRQTLSDQMKEK